MVYAAHAGLLPALEAVLRAAALTCRLETLRVLLRAVMDSVPALQRLELGRDGYLFMTLRKLVGGAASAVGGRGTVRDQGPGVGTSAFAWPSVLGPCGERRGSHWPRARLLS